MPRLTRRTAKMTATKPTPSRKPVRSAGSTAKAAGSKASKAAPSKVPLKGAVAPSKLGEKAKPAATKRRRKTDRTVDEKPRSVDIREMTLDDLPDVYALGERLFTADEWTTLYRTWDEYDLLRLYAEDGEACLVAEDDNGRLQGFVLGSVIEKRGSAWRYGWVVWLGVRPRAKGRGIATKLLDSLTDIFIDRGVRLLLADTQVENDRAVKFFERHGFGHPREHVFLEKNIDKEADRDGRKHR